MKKLPNSAKLGLVGAVLALALVAGWFALIAPKRSEAARLQAQIDDARTQLIEARHGGAPQRAPTIRVADLFELSRAMPNRTDMPNVLLQLSDVAAETGVSFESITPHDPVSFGSYQQVGIDLVFEGRFYDLSDFLYRLRNLVGVHEGVLDATGRLFSVDSISFDEGQLQFPQVRATLTVSAYIFGDGTAAPVPAGATSAGSATTTTSTTTSTAAPGTEDTQPIPAAPPGATAAGA
jgi:hypothetical protein